MKHLIGPVLVGAALWLDTASYYRQIKKVVKEKHSNQVSTTAYLYKIAKALCALVGLWMYNNWAGFTMEVFMLIVYIVSLIVIANYKPKKWSLWK